MQLFWEKSSKWYYLNLKVFNKLPSFYGSVMINFCIKLARPWYHRFWSNTSLDVAAKVGLTLKSIKITKKAAVHEQKLRIRRKRLPEYRCLSQGQMTLTMD